MLRKDTYIMKKKLIAAILTGAMLVAGMSATVWADGEKSLDRKSTRLNSSHSTSSRMPSSA